MKVHGVVHVLDLERLERVRGRIDVTRDEPHRHANATRSVRQPDHGAMLSGERVERGAHFLSARKTYCSTRLTSAVYTRTRLDGGRLEEASWVSPAASHNINYRNRRR
jgi:hypothetical protein